MQRTHSIWPWIVAIMIAVPVLYIASFGPVCWLTIRFKLTGDIINFGYRPIVWSMDRSPRCLREFALWYSTVGGDDRSVWYCDMCSGANLHFRNFGR